jgi:hypothetical protein
MSDLTIHAGPHRHDTHLGPICADRPLPASVLAALVAELERQQCDQRTVASATPIDGESGRFLFERIPQPKEQP